MDDFKSLQMTIDTWARRNFGNARVPYHPLLGVGEEVGELMHAHLKMEQGIRGTKEEHREAAKDAIGDIVIYLADYCNLNDYDLDECINIALKEVQGRDWNKHKINGTTE